MNGPQQTACLAKVYNNGKYKRIEGLVLGKNQYISGQLTGVISVRMRCPNLSLASTFARQ